MTKRSPASTRAMNDEGKLPTYSVSKVLSKVMTCDALTTESSGNPLTDAGRNTLPGALAKAVFLVITATIAVL